MASLETAEKITDKRVSRTRMLLLLSNQSYSLRLSTSLRLYVNNSN